MSARARSVAACAAVVLALGLTGCGGTDAPATTPTTRSTSMASLRDIPVDTLRERVVEAGRLAVRTLGTTPWRLTGGPAAEQCSAGGQQGLRIAWGAGGPPSDDVGRDARAVADAYRDAGWTVRTQRSADGLVVRVVAVRDDVGVVEFDAAPESTGVDVGSVCVPGDVADANRGISPSPPLP